MRVIAQLLANLAKRIFRLGKKPNAKVTPEKLQPNQVAKPQAAQAKGKQVEQTGDAKPDNSTFFVDRLEAGGSEPMRKFYSKHRERLRNQDAGPDQGQGMSH